jgi:hypothetical protein
VRPLVLPKIVCVSGFSYFCAQQTGLGERLIKTNHSPGSNHQSWHGAFSHRWTTSSNQSHRLLSGLVQQLIFALSVLVRMNIEIFRQFYKALSPLMVTDTTLALKADE